jgi:hypothetical protein
MVNELNCQHFLAITSQSAAALEYQYLQILQAQDVLDKNVEKNLQGS